MSNQNQKTAIRAHQARTGVNYTTARRAVLAKTTRREPFLAPGAKTTDPAVLQALADHRLLERHFHFLRNEFVTRVTDQDTAYFTKAWGIVPINNLSAVGGEKPGGEHGRWKQGYQGLGWIPAKNSRLEAEFNALNNIPSVPVPGIEHVTTLILGNRIYTPAVFALDGVAWLYLPDDVVQLAAGEQDRYVIEGNWEPVARSEAIRAGEVWSEQNKTRRLTPLDEAERERVEFLFEEDQRRKDESRKSQPTLFVR